MGFTPGGWLLVIGGLLGFPLFAAMHSGKRKGYKQAGKGKV